MTKGNEILLNTIADGCKEILSWFLFEFNNEKTRSQINATLSSYLNSFQITNKIKWFLVEMDGSNNTAEVINSNKGIVSVTVEINNEKHKAIFIIARVGVKGSFS